ncbi:other/FunK1 protein kinase [Coprinopsis cinerea okayama7|uniref:Other/FunK1 protein kinase n=1 Tax=Coprinopsis cinerea (strain Okayama-7 / 130 / ATCC MYA-4618 / FGSC 9003) TaxID=240176 RepID=A8NB15_COPC7|nr:other/FunK1 protein kinase [Coprinopsis cinerea okayama7\|eukprot:XP_001832017.1 other/FunK1 protein kinase [Coprinopsis cinerea okayama7\
MKPTTSTVSIEEFVSNHLPSDNANAFDTVFTTLKSERLLVSTSQPTAQKSSEFGYGITALKSFFQSYSPNPSKIVESLRTVCEVASDALQRLGIRATGGDRLSIRANEGIDLSKNACIAKNFEGPLSPCDVVVPITILCGGHNEEPGSDIVERVVATMNDDARRTFIYGITIHREQVTVGRFSRSHVIHSRPFTLTESADMLIRVITALLTATDEQLGYDPLVTRLPDNSYVYQLPPEEGGSNPLFYHSLELLSHYPSTSLGDRTARIWRAVQVLSPDNRRRVAGTPDRVLKDVWVDAEMRTEAEIQEDLFRDIKAVTTDVDWRKRPIFQDFLERDVESLAEALQGDNFKRYFSCIVAKYVAQLDTRATSTTSPSKRRCFFVYESVCTPLHDISTFGEVIDILKQCVIALRLMFCAGWVHRDISTGNILSTRSGSGQRWQVKLSDLEYSKKFPDTSHPEDEHMMGTPFFMPCEIQMERHVFPINPERERSQRYPKRPVVYGYQHDLESIWWIILWFATMRVDQDLCPKFGRLHFQQPMNEYCTDRRWLLFRDPSHLATVPLLDDALPSELLDSNFLDELQMLKHQIHGEYMIRNAEGKQEDIGTYSYVISQSFTLFFERLEESRAIWKDLKLSITAESEGSTKPYRYQRKRRASDREVDRKEEGVWVERKVVEKRRRKDDRPKQDRPTKKARFDAPVPAVEAPFRRSGPVTRSMTRAAQNTGPVTRAAARRMHEAAASKNKTTTTTTKKSRR